MINKYYDIPKPKCLVDETNEIYLYMYKMILDLIKDGNDYKIIGLPYYNEEYKKTEFEEAILAFISAI